ncbi:hypothetical protein S40288_05556, partial [Stachybotrys chartarum IBT 40288]
CRLQRRIFPTSPSVPSYHSSPNLEYIRASLTHFLKVEFLVAPMSSAESVEPHGVKARASLACLPCRSRHIRCDARRPSCTRCLAAGKPCLYAKSRRGGLDREALAAARRRQGEAAAAEANPDQYLSPEALSSRSRSSPEAYVPMSTESSSGVVSSASSQDNLVSFDLAGWLPETSSDPALSIPSPSLDIHEDVLVSSYYSSFHPYHPCVLPRQHFQGILQGTHAHNALHLLVAVMRYIGSIYDQSDRSQALRNDCEVLFSTSSGLDPFLVQCHLLYSIPLFWHGDKIGSQNHMDSAVRIATELKMHQQDFAVDHGRRDPVLQECWRRTWWELYCVDALYMASTRTTPFPTKDIEATVDLPCEELEYESGKIPVPMTLQDFDCREFSLEDNAFSSFAYFIGSIRCSVQCLNVIGDEAPTIVKEERVETVSSTLKGWLLLLPRERKTVMSKDGVLDELMFLAHGVIHAQYSDLNYNLVESLSSCAKDTPAHQISNESVNIHTVRILQSIQAQIRLLALPVRPSRHTPFVTCMFAVGTLALLSACKFIFKDRELAVARDQIRMVIGSFKELGVLWPETMRNVKEIQMIAQDVLGLGRRAASASSASQQTPRQLQGIGVDGTEMVRQTSSEDAFVSSSWVQLSDPQEGFFCSWF